MTRSTYVARCETLKEILGWRQCPWLSTWRIGRHLSLFQTWPHMKPGMVVNQMQHSYACMDVMSMFTFQRTNSQSLTRRHASPSYCWRSRRWKFLHECVRRWHNTGWKIGIENKVGESRYLQRNQYERFGKAELLSGHESWIKRRQWICLAWATCLHRKPVRTEDCNPVSNHFEAHTGYWWWSLCRSTKVSICH